MAYNFVTNTIYPIHFHELEMLFLKKNLLHFQYQDEWLINWLKILKKANQDTNKSIEKKQNLSFTKFEMAQKKLIFPSFTFYFHFFIAGARLFIEKTNPKIHKITLDRIQNQSFPLDWTPTSNWKKAIQNQTPIICTKFPLGGNEYLLIDGNHRLTAKIQTRQKSIKSYILHPQAILYFNILPALIDMTMYLFLIESSNFAKALSKDTYTHQQIFNSSFIHSTCKDLLQ
ncbi:hypothetical protein PVK73_28855 [Bacillus thuringiensis]